MLRSTSFSSGLMLIRIHLQRAANLSDDDDDFEVKPKKKAAPVKKAKPAVALPETDDDEKDSPAPGKVRLIRARSGCHGSLDRPALIQPASTCSTGQTSCR